MGLKLSTDESLLNLASELLEQALGHMRTHGIAATPENIMVWYHYVQEDTPKLNLEIDRLIDRQLAFSAQISSQLYYRFFTEMDRKKLELLRGAIAQVIKAFASHVQVLSGDIVNYESVLNECAERLSEDQDEASLARLVDTLLQETQRARHVSSNAREKIEAITQEIADLRGSLQELERNALEDALTGIANRRAFDQMLNQQLSQIDNGGDGCCLLLIDIDHFKKFNDKYGHQSGDKVLRFVATVLKKMTKGQDFVARHGGEEFAVILPSTKYTGGMSLARTLASSISSSRLTIDAEQNIVDFLTVSVGVSWGRKTDTAETLFARADASLYRAKEKGRNRVVGQQELDSR